MMALDDLGALRRLPPLRSRRVLRAAKGKPCTLRLPTICNGNNATTVPCHIRDRHKGMGQKSSDSSIVFGCSDCHDYLDHHFFDGRVEPVVLRDCIIRAMQETLEILIREMVIGWPADVEGRPKSLAPVSSNALAFPKPTSSKKSSFKKSRPMGGRKAPV